MDACAPDALLARLISTLGAEPTGLPSAGLNVPMVRVVMFLIWQEKWKSELHESGQVARDRRVDGKETLRATGHQPKQNITAIELALL